MDSRMALEPPGRAAAAATYGVGGSIAGLLRTAVGGLRRALYPLTWVQRQRHAAIFFFANGRPAPAAMELEDGPRAAGASGRGGDLRGRGSIAGLLRTAVGGLRRALYPLTWVQRQRHAAIFFFANGRPAPAAMELEDGPRAAGASGRGGDLRGRGSIAGLLRTAVGGLRRALYPLT